MQHKERELLEYLVLMLGLLIFFVLLIVFRYERMTLKIVSMLASLFYLVWGIVHQAITGRIGRKVILEYFFISTMVFLLFYLFLSV